MAERWSGSRLRRTPRSARSPPTRGSASPKPRSSLPWRCSASRERCRRPTPRSTATRSSRSRSATCRPTSHGWASRPPTRWRTRSFAAFEPPRRCRAFRPRAIWSDRGSNAAPREAMMRIRFWGTRGSLATPGPTTLRYGGNTSCVEARAADGTLIVLDCGTGAHRLGQSLMAEGPQPVRGHLMITHTHWDHIQGFPFFAPVFAEGSQWDLYAPGGLGERLEAVLSAQMQHPYFPVTLAQLAATIRYHNLGEGALTVGGVRVVAQYLNHPALTLGYRLEADGVAVVYACDHEPHMRGRAEGPVAGSTGATSEVMLHAEDARHVAFLEGADLVIHDAQYTAEDYPDKINWGHSPAETAVDYALAAHARRLALTHHDPLRSDEAVDRIVAACRARVRKAGGSLEV